MRVRDVLQLMPIAERVKIIDADTEETITSSYADIMLEFEKESILEGELVGMRLLTETWHTDWKRLGLMPPENPDGQADLKQEKGNLQMKIYHGLYVKLKR